MHGCDETIQLGLKKSERNRKKSGGDENCYQQGETENYISSVVNR